jgi:hypothetical protein
VSARQDDRDEGAEKDRLRQGNRGGKFASPVMLPQRL